MRSIYLVWERKPQYFTLKVQGGVIVVYFYQKAYTDKFDTAGKIHIYLAMRLASGVLGILRDMAGTTGMANLWGTTALWFRKKLGMVMVCCYTVCHSAVGFNNMSVIFEVVDVVWG